MTKSPDEKKKSISLLLGAGFSAPVGYPIGDQLNNRILNCKGENFAFNTDGTLCRNTDGTKPDWGYKTSYDLEFEFCQDLIQHYTSSVGNFDYEKFFDYLNDEAINDQTLIANFKPEKYGTKKDLASMVEGTKNIYIQLVEHFLVDGNKKSWYDDDGFMLGPIFKGYTGILNWFKKVKKYSELNVHTLNHDLFFERLNRTEWINGDLSDGFEEIGSPYYGSLSVKSAEYKCRLSRYTGIYRTSFRLFKLHGSKDYGVFYESDKESALLKPDNYLKTRFGIGFGDFYKERTNNDGELYYDRCWVNRHSDFLTGTTSKIVRYKEPLLYKILFEHFKNNLKEADQLLVIGYGAKDAEINQMLVDFFDHVNKPVYIVDPFPSTAVKELRRKLNAKLIEKHLEDIKDEDLAI